VFQGWKQGAPLCFKAQGRRATFRDWHGWEVVGKVFGLFFWFLCFGMLLGDGSLAERVT